MKLKALIVALALMFGLTINASAQMTYAVDLSYASQSAFKLFGSTASTNPIGKVDITAKRSGWSTEFIFVDGLDNDQNEGDMVRYYDGIFKKSWESGKLSGTAAMELFYAPVQYGSPSSTFISPLVTVMWTHNKHFSVEVGAQYVGTHNTDYGGDRIYGWIQPTFSTSWKALTFEISPGYILGETKRTTQYVSSKLALGVGQYTSVYVSYLEAKSWGTGSPGMVPIDGTWTGGLKLTF